MISRRALLRMALASAATTAACGPVGKAGTPGRIDRKVETYGEKQLNRGEWFLPHGVDGSPVVVLVHGGFWRPTYDRHLEDDVAMALVRRGYAVWNIDYRSATAPWPATFVDAHAAVEHLATSHYRDRLDLSRVAVVGHSAGGHLALWLASRTSLPAGSREDVGARPSVPVVLAVAQAPVADLVTAARFDGGAVADLLDGSPDAEPSRYAAGSPLALLPVHDVRLLVVHGDADTTVPLAQSTAYADAARRVGTPVDLRVLPGVGHFEHLDPKSSAVAVMFDALEHL